MMTSDAGDPAAVQRHENSLFIFSGVWYFSTAAVPRRPSCLLRL